MQRDGMQDSYNLVPSLLYVQMEISKVHGNLSEDAYKAQATQVMRSGPPSKASNQVLESLAQQLGLPKDAAEKVNKVGGCCVKQECKC
jgi:hypothetical protein